MLRSGIGHDSQVGADVSQTVTPAGWSQFISHFIVRHPSLDENVNSALKGRCRQRAAWCIAISRGVSRTIHALNGLAGCAASTANRARLPHGPAPPGLLGRRITMATQWRDAVVSIMSPIPAFRELIGFRSSYDGGVRNTAAFFHVDGAPLLSSLVRVQIHS